MQNPVISYQIMSKAIEFISAEEFSQTGKVGQGFEEVDHETAQSWMQALPSHCPASLIRIKLLLIASLLLARPWAQCNIHMIKLKLHHTFARWGLTGEGQNI